MNARSVRLIAAAFAFCGLLEATQLKVIADGWSFTPSLDGGPHLFEYHHDESDYSHLSETAPAVPHPRDTQYSITLHNPTNVAIAYAINDQPEQRIKPGVSVKWSVMGYKDNPAQFNIRFDSRDNKQISYHLENNMPFDFYLKDDRLDLTKHVGGYDLV
ncbi:MAG: hypothetical protein NTU79_06365 [Planctomycetota bacterium]|nr:hypothetical protein [Planctomycetota bacterium]